MSNYRYIRLINKLILNTYKFKFLHNFDLYDERDGYKFSTNNQMLFFFTKVIYENRIYITGREFYFS